MKSFSSFAKHSNRKVRQIVSICAIIIFAFAGLAQSQDASEETVVISGTVGLGGVVMRGLPGNPVTNSNGQYSAEVKYGWAGDVSPFKQGYGFEPAKRIYSAVISNQTNQDYTASILSYVISGNTGIAGVEMQGLPGNVVTGLDGSYTVTVDYGFSGIVKPVKEGFGFVPSSRTYSKISNNYTNQDYKATPYTYTISGTVGVHNVIMRGFPGIVVSGQDGNYRATVEYGWDGTVAPEREGYIFEPASRIYNKVTADRNSDSYKGKRQNYIISGTILSDKGEPMKGVKLYSTSGGPVVTGEKGKYYFSQEYGWSGEITPTQEGYTFTPKSRQYPDINRDQTNQNYTAAIKVLTISDTIKVKDRPIPGINIIANPGNIKTVTDNDGHFSIEVPYGWTGEITFSKTGIQFAPATKSYTNVTTDILNGIPAPPKSPIALPMERPAQVQHQVSKSEGRKILIVPDKNMGPEEIAQTKEDINVMAEIFDERFREPRLIEGVLRDFGDFFGRDNQQTEAIYIQGYGVVFAMEVNYQFSSLSQPDEEVKTEQNNDIDQTWEQAKQRILSSEINSTETKSSGREYEKQMVNILKTELIRTLKYASNIRNLQSDEWVIVSVSGSSQSTPESIFTGYGSSVGSSYGGGMMGGYGGGMMGGYGGGGGYGYGYGGGSSYGGMMGGYGASSPSGMMGGSGAFPSYEMMFNMMFGGRPFLRSAATNMMTMRVKKSDVDEFASEKINFEQFHQKVQIILY